MSPRVSRRDAILAAAARLVRESGAAHLTLDAVSAKAGVSKGGLLYHFQTKEALLEAMVVRLKETADKAKQDETAKLPPSPGRELKAHAMVMPVMEREEMKEMIAALVAAGVYDPDLTKGLRHEQEEMFERLEGRGLSPGFIRVVYFAVVGLSLTEILGSSATSRQRRQSFVDEILRLIDVEEERLGS